jgi:hypothetical protein
VYISEAHPDDEWQLRSNREDDVVFAQPRSLEQRREAARMLLDRFEYRMPVAVDPMDGAADRAYAAWPERIYVIAAGGRIAFKGGMGPFGFKTGKAERALRRVLAPA